MESKEITPEDIAILVEKSTKKTIGQIDSIIEKLLVFKKQVYELHEESINNRLLICASDEDKAELVGLNLEKELANMLNAKNDTEKNIICILRA